MAIDGIRNLSEAIKIYNNPNTSNDTKREILAKYPDVVKYVGNDTTKYEISDEDFDLAKAQGTQRAKDATGHDGSTHSTLSTIGTAVGSAAAGLAGISTTLGSNIAGNVTKGALNKLGKQTGDKLAEAAGKKASEKVGGKSAESAGKKNLGDIATVVLTAAVEAKYLIEKPNKEQIDAANKLAESELPDAMEALAETQDIMAEAEEEITELSEEAEEVNEDANDKIDEDKTKFDFYRAQYEALKAKAESGEKLTKEEKALMQKLAPLMEGLGTSIADTQEETSGAVSDLSDDMAEYQDTFDESAEVMADIEGVTDFAEGFDETTKTLCTVEAVSHTVNGIGAGLAAARLFAGGPWMWAFGAVGIAAAGLAVKSTSEQFKGAGIVGGEIEKREMTQDINSQTNDIYEEKLDTYAGQTELVDDLELEVPDDLELPEQPAVTTDGTDGSNPFGMQPANDGTQAGTRGADEGGNTGAGNIGNAANTGNAGGVTKENDPSYVSKMGNGSDWSEVMNGNIKRDSDNDIVKDSSGKVVLIQKYADAITSETGAKEGEFFTKIIFRKY